MNDTFLKACRGEQTDYTPIWMMRQAGRYLPEYQKVRGNVTFLELCKSPELCVEVTLQPIDILGMDAAILFSDILVIPDALNRGVHFVQGEGPRMTPLGDGDIGRLDGDGVVAHLQPVFEAVKRLRVDLPDETTLLGFCGAPWTVATYMIAGQGTNDQAPSRLFLYQKKDELLRLLDILADVSADYLVAQLDAGADAIHIAATLRDVEGVALEHARLRFGAGCPSSCRCATPSCTSPTASPGSTWTTCSRRQPSGPSAYARTSSTPPTSCRTPWPMTST